MRAARPEYDARSARTADASDIGSRHPARYGQNDCVMALGRSNWLFAGSLRAGQRAAAVMSLIQSAKLNGRDPYAYLRDVFTRLPTQRASRIAELLPHRWQPSAAA
jgi:transposase